MDNYIYLVLELFDEGYDRTETEIKLVTMDKNKAIAFGSELKEQNKKEHNLEYQLETWKDSEYVDTTWI